MAEKEEVVEAGLAAYEAYINSPDVIDRRVLVQRVYLAMRDLQAEEPLR